METTLIIGLGNPDPALEETYHNVGVLAVRWLAEQAAKTAGNGTDENGSARFRPYKGLFSYAKIENRIFIQPLVYMNESGRAVAEAIHAFSAAPSDIIIIHDDSDIPVGEFKRMQGGGSAGHKGIGSIIDHLRTEDFPRIRIGIRDGKEEHRKKAGDFVLSPISAADKKTFEEIFEKISDSLLSPKDQ